MYNHVHDNAKNSSFRNTERDGQRFPRINILTSLSVFFPLRILIISGKKMLMNLLFKKILTLHGRKREKCHLRRKRLYLPL